jgi:hypothetical protein
MSTPPAILVKYREGTWKQCREKIGEIVKSESSSFILDNYELLYFVIDNEFH